MNVIVDGKSELKGTISASGSKNAAIPLICASLLAKGKVLLRNVPRITDVLDLCEVIQALDCKIIFKGHTMLIDNTNLKYKPLLFEECKKMRGSYYLIGVFLTLFSKCEILLPGGCRIGTRPIDVHIQAFEDLGFDVKINDNILTVHKKFAFDEKKIVLKSKSVGASINAMFACLNINNVKIENCLFEPEGMDVVKLLQNIGYKITIQDNCLEYKKSNLEFKLTKHTIIPDRIEIMTYAVMGLMLGDIIIKKVNLSHLEKPLSILINSGFNISLNGDEIRAKKSIGQGFDIKTGPYPEFPTDLQPIFGALTTNTKGVSKIEETIFENRMQIYNDLINSGVDCKVKNNVAQINNNNHLNSANYQVSDLRHGAAILALAMFIGGNSTISDFEYVLRGYEDIINKLKKLGANISVVKTAKQI